MVSVTPGEMVGLTFEVDGETLISRQLSRFGEGVEDFGPAFEGMRDELYKIETAQFESQGSRTSSWVGLAESTAKAKGSDVIMVRTRRLFQSLTQPGGENIATITPTELAFGSSVFYGIFHQSTRPRTRLPRRPLIAFNDEDRQTLVRIMQRYLVSLIDNTGPRKPL